MGEQDWREAARGILVWEDCAVYAWWCDGWVLDVVRSIDTMASTFTGYRGERTLSTALAIPRLDNPDTRAAYDRRLALALGAPEVAIAGGVVIEVTGGYLVVRGYDAGGAHAWSGTARVGTNYPLLARALAWPAEKRVGR